MALPGTDYNPATGLDLSGGSNVDEYVINEFGGAAFRHWKTPFSPSALQASAVEADDCFTTLTFSSDKIAGKPLPLDGNSSYVLEEANPNPNPTLNPNPNPNSDQVHLGHAFFRRVRGLPRPLQPRQGGDRLVARPRRWTDPVAAAAAGQARRPQAGD